MNTPLTSFAPRLLAGFGTAALVAGVGLFASSRPAHTAGGPVPVTVANTVQNHDADNPARQSVQFVIQPDTYGTGLNVAVTSIPVPAHKRFVIEYVSAALGTGVGSVTMETISGGNLAAYYLIENTNSHTHRFFPTRIYADPGTNVSVYANSSDGNRVYGDVEISGYYVDVP